MPAIGEVAELQVLLTLRDQMSPAIAQVNSRIATLSGAAGLGGLAGVASKIESGFGKVGTALSHAGSQIGGLVKNIGLLGVGFGLFSAAGAIKGAIDTANSMASAIEKLVPITGETGTQVSKLIGVFEHFGISTDSATSHIAFMEKAVGLLTLNTVSAAASQDKLIKAEQAVTLAEDNLQKARDAKKPTTAAITAAEFKLTDAETKLKETQAALSSGTAAAAKFQTEFGLSLYDSTGKVKDANTILLNAADYWTGTASTTQKAALETKLFGRNFSEMIPVLNLGSQGILNLENQLQSMGLVLNEQNLVDLKNYQDSMRELGGVMNGLMLQVSLALIPSITMLAQNITAFVSTNRGNIVAFFQGAAKWAGDFAAVVQKDVLPVIQGIVGWWNRLPGPLKELLIAGFVTGKVTKFLFDTNLVTGLAGIGIKWAAQFTANVVGGALGTLFGGTAAAAQIGGAMTVGGTTAAAEMEAAMAAGGTTAAAELEAAMVAGGSGAGLSIASIVGKFLGIALPAAGVAVAVTGSQEFFDQHRNPFTGQETRNTPIGAYTQPGFFGGSTTGAPNDSGGTGGLVGSDQYSNLGGAAKAMAALGGAAAGAAMVIHDWAAELKAADSALKTIKKGGAASGKAADDLVAYFSDRSLTALGGIKNANAKISGDIKVLNADEKAAAARGDTSTASKLRADIAALKDRLASLQSTTNSKLSQIAAKSTSFTQYLSVNTDISVRSQQTMNIRSNLYGREIAT